MIDEIKQFSFVNLFVGFFIAGLWHVFVDVTAQLLKKALTNFLK